MIIKGNLVGNVSPRTNWNQTDSARADYLVGREKIVESISDAKKTGSDALINSKAYTNEQIKKARPYNLLDNSDFRNPVNQRGQQSYTNQYCIDRWIANSYGGNGTIAINTGYITLTPTSGNYVEINQILDNADKLTGKVITLAIKTAEYGTSIYNFTFGIGGQAADREITLIHYGGNTVIIRVTTTINLEWAALYEGEYTQDTLPEYQPKGYNVEALNCGALNVGHKFTLETTGWYAVDSVYQKDVNVTGLLTEDTVYIDLAIPSETKDLNTIEEIEDEFSKIYDVLIGNGAMSIRAKEIPTIALPIKIRVVR